MNVFDLVASLTLDSSEYDSSLESAEEKGTSFGDKLKTGLATGAKVAVGAVAALTTATIAVGKSIVDATGQVAEYGDQIDKESQKLGISTTAYQEWDAILQHSGSSISALKPAMKSLQAEVEKGGAAFEALGLSQEQVANMSSEELFSATITALQGMSDETERNALASDLLGKSFMELQPLLNTSAEDTEAMRQAVHDLGGVMSEEMVAASASYQDALQDMNTAIDGAKRDIIGAFLPAVTDVMGGLTQLFSGDPDSGIAQINNGVSKFIDQLVKMTPKLLELGTKLVTNLLTAIVQNLPELVKAGVDLIMNLTMGMLESLPAIIDATIELLTTITTYIVENLPEILQKGIEIVKSLADGLIQNLPTIIKAIGDVLVALIDFIMQDLPEIILMGVEIIFALAQGLIDNLPAIIEALMQVITGLITHILENLPQFIEMGLQLIVSLIAGIIQAIPQIIAALPQVIRAIFDAFRNIDWGELGRNLIQGIIDGIGQTVSMLWDAAVNAAKAALNAIKNLLGIRSPSRVFRDQIGKMIPEGMAIGIEANTDAVEDAMDNLSDLTTDPFGGGSNIVSFPGTGGGLASLGGVVINVYPSEGQDEEAIAEYVIDKLNLEYERAERAFA